MEVFVYGWFGKKNTGDETYKVVFPRLFPKLKLTFTDKLTAPGPVILGGGDVLNPSFLTPLARHKGDKYAASVTVRDQDLAMFKHVIARNPAPGTTTAPDFAFALEPDPARGQALIRQYFRDAEADQYQKVVVVVMNTYLCGPSDKRLARDDTTFRKVCFDLGRMFDETNASFLLLPFGNGFPTNDRVAAAHLYPCCKFWPKNCLFLGDISPQETLDVISAADALIGTRLHASIFACVGGTPFIDLTHHSKTEQFLALVGRPEWGVDYWHFDVNKVKSFLDHFLFGSHTLRQKLLAQTAAFRGQVTEAASVLQSKILG